MFGIDGTRHALVLTTAAKTILHCNMKVGSCALMVVDIREMVVKSCFGVLWDRLILFVTCCYTEGLFITRVSKRTPTNLLSVAIDRARLIEFD